jgi:tyrosyl-tRNA synthetase
MGKDAKIRELLTRNVAGWMVQSHLLPRLKSGKHLRIKHGIDPTGEKIHIGRAVVLWKLREFQELGHKIVIIIGDFTAQIGDPSDKLGKRPFLSAKQVERNMRGYRKQIGKILDLDKVEWRRNSEWLGKLDFREVAELADIFSVQQMLARSNFHERLRRNETISLREFLYPLMQGYDSVAIRADVELGGEDQIFNLLAGRDIQSRYGQDPQDVMFTKMLLGLDGRKMSTSWGNVVNIDDEPHEQYGKLMSMHDKMIPDYLLLVTQLPLREVQELTLALKKKKANPRDIKARVAFEVVKLYHGERVAIAAEREFNRVFRQKQRPETVKSVKVKSGKYSVLDLLVAAKLVSSKSEARRIIAQGGVRVDTKKISDASESITPKTGTLLQVGKRRFVKLTVGE